MKKAFSLALLALTLAGCGAPYAEVVSVGLDYPNGHAPGAYDPQRSSAPLAGPTPSAPVAVNDGEARKTAVSLGVSASHLVLLMKRTQKLSALVTYADGTRDGDVTWSSTDDTVVTINPTTGEAAGVRPGIATLQVRSAIDATHFANITVTVREGVVEDLLATVSPAQSALGVGETVQLEASITNSSTRTHPNGRWASSNERVAFVNEQGLVTARRPGRATITFTSAQNSTVSAQATITVAEPTQATEPTEAAVL